ncbi:MAG TPA: cell wall hydrolase [Limnochordia bacterium]
MGRRQLIGFGLAVVLSLCAAGAVQAESDDLHLLARLITAEAGGEPFLGQVAVGAVVLNRVASEAFPDTIEAVIFQPGQFEVVARGRMDVEPTAQALAAARLAWLGVDPTGGALFFYNPALARATAFWARRSILITIGSHAFAR